MGKYDDISPDDLRADLVRFAQLILELDEHGALLPSVAEVQRILGDLRQKLFAYEVRCTAKLPDPEERRGAAARDEGSGGEADPLVQESLRVVREALERQREMIEDWEGSSEDQDDS